MTERPLSVPPLQSQPNPMQKVLNFTQPASQWGAVESLPPPPQKKRNRVSPDKRQTKKTKNHEYWLIIPVGVSNKYELNS